MGQVDLVVYSYVRHFNFDCLLHGAYHFFMGQCWSAHPALMERLQPHSLQVSFRWLYSGQTMQRANRASFSAWETLGRPWATWVMADLRKLPALVNRPGPSGEEEAD